MSFGAKLLAFIAVIYSLNWILVDGIGAWTGLNAFVISSTGGVFDGFSLQYILGQLFRVFAFIMVEWAETLQVGSLIGQKTVINEFVAYLSLADMKAVGELSEKSIVISTYALCGFVIFLSIAIQIGDIGSLGPNPQGDLSKLGLKALMAATLATMMTATIVGALFG
jgi:CNT family concentrative nucleoside transporter